MSKKIILRQSVKSGVAVVFFFGLGMASINAQTTQTTQPTGKVGINTTNPTETLDVKGKVRIQELYTDNQQTGTNNATFTATNVVTVDNNGVLGKKTLSSITAAQTPNLPWKKVASTDNAVPAEGLKIYSKYAVGIGDYSAAGSSVGSSFEINGGGTSQLGLINGTNKWDISTEDQNLTFTKRKPEAKQGRMFSLTENAVMYLGDKMSHSDGSGAKLILDGKNGKIGINKNTADHHLDVAGTAKISDNIFLNDKWNIGLKGNSLMFYSSGTKADTNNKFTLTNEGKLFLGKDMNGDGNGTGANVFLDGKDGKVAIGKNSADYKLDVAGDAKISGLKDGNGYTATHMVVADTNGVLGKANIPTIPTEPWQVAGGTTQATANNQKIYQNNKVGIGDYSSTDIGSNFEINGGGSSQLGLINGTSKWDISTEDKALTFTKRKPENGRIFSITDKAIIYLGNTLLTQNGSGAKLILDGGNGKIGINKNSADYNLDVVGDAKISGLKTTSDDITNGGTTSKYSPAKMVVADENGVLGKVDIPTIPSIPTEPWRQLGSTNEATTNSQNIYQNGKVGIGNYASTSSFDSDFEVSSNRNGYQIGIANGDSKWNLSTESGEERAFSITKRHPNNQGRLLSLDKDAKLYLGNTLLNTSGSGAKILVDGGQGKIGVGKNSAEYNLDVAGNAKISGLPDKGSNDTVKMVVVDNSGVLKKADIPSGNGNGVKNHTGSNDAVQCNASNAGTIHYKEGVTVNKQSTSVMGFCMKTADNKYRWFYIFGGAGTTTGSEAATPNFGDGL